VHTIKLDGLALGTGAIALGALVLAFSFVPATLNPTNSVFSGGKGAQSQYLQLHGRVDVFLYDEHGAIKDERHLDNLIVDSGLEGVAYRIAPHDGSVTPNSPWNYVAIGTGVTPPASGDTALQLEIARIQDPIANYTTTSGKQVKLQVSFASGVGTGVISESGLFNAASGGAMLARQAFAPIVKGASDTLTVTWVITLSST
jgi:hypothetical protein